MVLDKYQNNILLSKDPHFFVKSFSFQSTKSNTGTDDEKIILTYKRKIRWITHSTSTSWNSRMPRGWNVSDKSGVGLGPCQQHRKIQMNCFEAQCVFLSLQFFIEQRKPCCLKWRERRVSRGGGEGTLKVRQSRKDPYD